MQMEDLEIHSETETDEQPAPPDTESAAGPEEQGSGTAAQAPPVEMPLPLEEAPPALSDEQLQAIVEAVVYVAEEPLTPAQIASGLAQPVERVGKILRGLIAEFEKAAHGIGIREVAGGFKMGTKAEHHDAVRNFVKSLKPPLKLSLPALETLAVIAYKQPVTAPEIQEIRGVQGAGVLKTLLDRKLITHSGRKNVIGKPMLYKTTKEFLIQFGLKDINELPSLKEFEEIRRMAFPDEVTEGQPAMAEAQPEPEAQSQPEPGTEQPAPPSEPEA
jgi:segregation and condensation protein B